MYPYSTNRYKNCKDIIKDDRIRYKWINGEIISCLYRCTFWIPCYALFGVKQWSEVYIVTSDLCIQLINDNAYNSFVNWIRTKIVWN